ncbi:MAG TPA: Spy/CpxP family protein refolding chaperone [Xanthobacteraceae bacterium]|nr:Spy/CpxP family protein refolding chaperone [Xanthobacteraceae bacterium]
MWKAAVVGAGALALVGTTILMAQDRGPRPGPSMAQADPGGGGPRWGGGPGWRRGAGREGERPRMSIDDMRAFADARIAALHAGLELRPDQERYWPPFEAAVRSAVKDRIDRIQARRAAERDGAKPAEMDPVERLKRRADAMSRRGAALKQIADAAAPLYQSLDDAQKNRFRMLARFGHHHHRGGGWHGRPERGGDGGR